MNESTITPKPQKRYPHIREVFLSQELVCSPASMRSAALQLLLCPPLLMLIMWFSGEPLTRILLLLEVLLVLGFAALELWKAREASRKLALGVVLLNFLLFGSVVFYMGNFLVLLGLSISTFVFLLQIFEVRFWISSRLTTWSCLAFGFCILCSLAFFGQWQVRVAGKAYQDGDYQHSYQALKRAGYVFPLRGGSRMEQAFLLFRQAELQLRMGKVESARQALLSCQTLSQQLPGPKQDASFKERRASLAYALINKGIPELFAKIHRFRAWKEKPSLEGDPLGEGVRYQSYDQLSWGQAFFAQVS